MSAEINKKIFELTLAVYRVTDIFPKEEVLKRQIREKANEILSNICEYDRKVGESGIRFLLAKIQTIRTYLGIARYAKLVKYVNIAVLDREYEFFINYFERESIKLTEDTLRADSYKNIQQTQAVSNISLPRPIRRPKVERSIIYPVRNENNNHVITNNYSDNLEGRPTFGKWISNGVNSQKASFENGNGNGHVNNKNVIGHFNDFADDGFASSGKTNGFNERQKTILDYIRTNQQIKSTDLTSIFSDKFSIKTLQRDLAALISSNTIQRQGDKRWAIYKLKS